MASTPPPNLPDTPPSASLATILVPARLASTRFPGKVLAAETGRPLVQHVVEAARRARCARRVVVATDSDEVRRAVAAFGTEVVMTSARHENGTSRLAEAVGVLGLDPREIVVNAQGDEPEMAGAVVDAAVAALLSTPGAFIGTVAAPLVDPREIGDANVVKVVRDSAGRGMYFSRAPIPHDRDGTGHRGSGARPLRHVGVYAYRCETLQRYAMMPPSDLERCEQLEQLRALDAGWTIGVGLVNAAHPGIDTPEQYRAFVERWRARG